MNKTSPDADAIFRRTGGDFYLAAVICGKVCVLMGLVMGKTAETLSTPDLGMIEVVQKGLHILKAILGSARGGICVATEANIV